MQNLGPEKGFIFRIVHRDNLPWILANGVHCRNSDQVDPDYVNIGNPELIDKRHTRLVPIPPGGTLSDYVPFYFTPRSPMLLNIKTGYNGIRQRNNEEIVILVSSLFEIRNQLMQYVFTNAHAYMQTSQFYTDLARLDVIDWPILRNSDFKRDNDDLRKVDRYQAEALIHHHVPIGALLGIVCCSEARAVATKTIVDDAGIDLKVAARPGWYF